jgi:hypothetical protein
MSKPVLIDTGTDKAPRRYDRGQPVRELRPGELHDIGVG